jgi:hypothetical protein
MGVRPRSRLVRRVLAHGRAAYVAALGEYMAAKATFDAIVAEARRRGVRRQRSSTRSASAADFRFEVSTTTRGVRAVADGAVRFPEAVRVPLRDQLRAAVARIPAEPGEILRGTFVGELPPNSKTDVENRVLLNMGLSEHCLRRGFAFEHDRKPPEAWACDYDYRGVRADDPFELWRAGRLLAGWTGIALDRGLTAPAIWWGLRTSRETIPRGPSIAVAPTLFQATVASPRAEPQRDQSSGGRRRRRCSMDSHGSPVWC